MLLPDNVHPEQSIYYNGVFLLQIIRESRSEEMLSLYFRVREIREMSLPVFVLCLDWLFVLGVLDVNQQGLVELCS